jgi:L-ribulokinase
VRHEKNIREAAEKMGRVEEKTYKPIPENVEAYEKLYKEFKALHDYFGCGQNDVMKMLKKMKADARNK